MKSPFPGMDPYLEQHWRDVHHALITYARDQLRPMLPHDLRPRIEERVFVESDDGEPLEIYPDVYVVEYPRRKPAKDSLRKLTPSRWRSRFSFTSIASLPHKAISKSWT